MGFDKNITSYSDYYEDSLYKLQDGVLHTVKACGVPFYLTGGTALSRGYYNHRYSDDLDFFVNRTDAFNAHADAVLSALSDSGFFWNQEIEFRKSPDFYSVILHHRDHAHKLKVDFVNDIAAHFGALTQTPLFYRTDSVRNILSNKISAVFRFAAKDMADIREICLHEHFDWAEIFAEVRQKELGVEPTDVAQILEGTPEVQFETIKWIHKPVWERFRQDMTQIARDMVSLSENSLSASAH